MKLSKKYLYNPERIAVESEEVLLSNITHEILNIDHNNRIPFGKIVKIGQLNSILTPGMVDIISMKSNDSFQSKGIKILNRNSILPEIKTGDLFCKIINNDPFTYKVDFFHNQSL